MKIVVIHTPQRLHEHQTGENAIKVKPAVKYSAKKDLRTFLFLQKVHFKDS